MKTVDELLESVHARGLKLANLFQFELPTGEWRWQANLTDGLSYWGFERGPTATAALTAALFTASTTTGEPAFRPSKIILKDSRPPVPTPTTKLRI